MAQDVDNLNWYKASLLKIADDIGTPRVESSSNIQKLFKRSFGISIDKKSAGEIELIIKYTQSNSAERMERISSFLSENDFYASDIALMSAILSPLE